MIKFIESFLTLDWYTLISQLKKIKLFEMLRHFLHTGCTGIVTLCAVILFQLLEIFLWISWLIYILLVPEESCNLTSKSLNKCAFSYVWSVNLSFLSQMDSCFVLCTLMPFSYGETRIQCGQSKWILPEPGLCSDREFHSHFIKLIHT